MLKIHGFSNFGIENLLLYQPLSRGKLCAPFNNPLGFVPQPDLLGYQNQGSGCKPEPAGVNGTVQNVVGPFHPFGVVPRIVSWIYA